MNIQKMMQQAQQVQLKMQELQEKLKDIEVSGESGGGLVSVVINCSGQVRSVSVDPSLMVVDDKETMEDLIVAALNNAADAREDKIAEETQKAMAGTGIPPEALGGAGGGLPF